MGGGQWQGTAHPQRAQRSGSTAWPFLPDGQRIVTGSGDQTAKVWEAASGKELLTLKGHSRRVRSVAFSPDGQRIVTGSGDGTAKVWDAASGKELLTSRDSSAAIISVAFSPDGQRIVTGSEDRTAKVWERPRQGTAPLKGHTHSVLCGGLFPGWPADCHRQSGSDGQGVGGGQRQADPHLQGHEGGISALAFSPDGQRIVTGSEDKTAKVWEASNGQELLTLKGHSDEILGVAFSPDGRRIVTGSRDQTAKVWEAASGQGRFSQEFLTLQGHAACVFAVAFSPDGHRIITASGDHTAKVWEAATADQVAIWQGEDEDAGSTWQTCPASGRLPVERDQVSRARDPGAIKQWLVLAPIAYAGRSGTLALDPLAERGRIGALALAQEQVPHEANLQARAGERIQAGEIEGVWRAVRLDDYLLDFNKLLNANVMWSVAYAVCYIESEADQSNLTMRVGSDDQSRIYLNGKDIYWCEASRGYLPDQDVVAGMALKAGLNVLVFKVVNETGDWLGSIRFTDAAGQPLKGIRVTLDPGKPDQ